MRCASWPSRGGPPPLARDGGLHDRAGRGARGGVGRGLRCRVAPREGGFRPTTRRRHCPAGVRAEAMGVELVLECVLQFGDDGRMLPLVDRAAQRGAQRLLFGLVAPVGQRDDQDGRRCRAPELPPSDPAAKALRAAGHVHPGKGVVARHDGQHRLDFGGGELLREEIGGVEGRVLVDMFAKAEADELLCDLNTPRGSDRHGIKGCCNAALIPQVGRSRSAVTPLPGRQPCPL